MKAKELQPGDRFKVDKPDPEGPVRVCVSNDPENGLRFSFPDRLGRYWCYMGEECEVELVSRAGTNAQIQMGGGACSPNSTD